MANQKLLDAFLDTKRILCRNDYYIHIPKKVIHVTNSENMIPHLMGMQYIGRPDMFTGDRGVYMIKKGRLKYDSLEKLVRKYYRGENKQASLLAMINGKIDNLHRIEDIAGIKKMLIFADIQVNEKLVKTIFRLNQRFGKYHTLEMLSNLEQLMEECRDKRDEALVKGFIELWRRRL